MNLCYIVLFNFYPGLLRLEQLFDAIVTFDLDIEVKVYEVPSNSTVVYEQLEAMHQMIRNEPKPVLLDIPNDISEEVLQSQHKDIWRYSFHYLLVGLVSKWLEILNWTSHWRHNERDGVSNHPRLNCLLNRMFRRRSKKTSTFRVIGLCEGNPPVTSEFPSQKASNEENVSIRWRHHVLFYRYCITVRGVVIFPETILPVGSELEMALSVR